MRLVSIILGICALLIQGCFSEDDGPSNCTVVPVSEQDDIIEQYIIDNNLTMQNTPSGARYSIDVQGESGHIMYGDTIQVEYQGTLLNGAIFDQGTFGVADHFIIEEGTFIVGFEEALIMFSEGSEGTIIVPGALGYGCFPPFGSIIGENEILVFYIKIHQVNS